MTNLSPLLILASFLIFISGCSDKPSTTASGEALYHYHCASCHKDNGHGNFLLGVPNNADTQLSRNAVITLITKGYHSKPGMEPIADLSNREAQKIVDYLATLR